MSDRKIKWLIGVDEAGRGPLAGPVAVGVTLVPVDFDWSLLEGVGDSKRLKSENREAIFRQAKLLRKNDQLNFAVAMVGASVVDKIGIVPAINLAMKRALNKTTVTSPKLTTSFPRSFPRSDLGKGAVKREEVAVKLDGGLKAPAEYINQETIIKGDSKELVIGLASIVAKVTRDKYMQKLNKKPEFAIYDFAGHKGYGTKVHRQVVSKYGLSREHRRSFCRNIIIKL